MPTPERSNQSEGGAAVWVFACAGLLLFGRRALWFTQGVSLQSFSMERSGERSGAEMLESAAASFGRLGGALTLGRFAMTTMPGACGWLRGSARGSAVERSSQVSDQFLAAITWPGLSETEPLSFVFCGIVEDKDRRCDSAPSRSGQLRWFPGARWLALRRRWH
jgi:hypothetical protein